MDGPRGPETVSPVPRSETEEATYGTELVDDSLAKISGSGRQLLRFAIPRLSVK
jgi:hypothetical protein